jgi:NAD(P)-dependent dehydrogenase (short-subunit alcohol dehydrogenase family)
VTGASRGVGRGIALGLLAAGFRVYGSGRSIDQAELPQGIRRLRCDHLEDEETTHVFETIRSECARLDLLVNCAWGGYEKMVECGEFTWAAPFWEQPPHGWTGIAKAATDKMTSDMAVGVKPHAIPVISLYPGLVRTESVLAAAKSGALDLSTSESPDFIGRVINALFHDPNLMTWTGQVLVAAAVAKEFGVLDIDGSSPPALTLEDI